MNSKNNPTLEMTPRRKQFFRMVSEGLKVGFEGEDLSRVENFVRYCKGELDFKAMGPLHQVGFAGFFTGTDLAAVNDRFVDRLYTHPCRRNRNNHEWQGKVDVLV